MRFNYQPFRGLRASLRGKDRTTPDVLFITAWKSFNPGKSKQLLFTFTWGLQEARRRHIRTTLLVRAHGTRGLCKVHLLQSPASQTKGTELRPFRPQWQHITSEWKQVEAFHTPRLGVGRLLHSDLNPERLRSNHGAILHRWERVFRSASKIAFNGHLCKRSKMRELRTFAVGGMVGSEAINSCRSASDRSKVQ